MLQGSHRATLFTSLGADADADPKLQDPHISDICTVSPKNKPLLFLNSSVKRWSILIIFGTQNREKRDVSDRSFAHLTLILLLQYTL